MLPSSCSLFSYNYSLSIFLHLSINPIIIIIILQWIHYSKTNLKYHINYYINYLLFHSFHLNFLFIILFHSFNYLLLYQLIILFPLLYKIWKVKIIVVLIISCCSQIITYVNLKKVMKKNMKMSINKEH